MAKVNDDGEKIAISTKDVRLTADTPGGPLGWVKLEELTQIIGIYISNWNELDSLYEKNEYTGSHETDGDFRLFVGENLNDPVNYISQIRFFGGKIEVRYTDRVGGTWKNWQNIGGNPITPDGGIEISQVSGLQEELDKKSDIYTGNNSSFPWGSVRDDGLEKHYVIFAQGSKITFPTDLTPPQGSPSGNISISNWYGMGELSYGTRGEWFYDPELDQWEWSDEYQTMMPPQNPDTGEFNWNAPNGMYEILTPFFTFTSTDPTTWETTTIQVYDFETNTWLVNEVEIPFFDPSIYGDDYLYWGINVNDESLLQHEVIQDTIVYVNPPLHIDCEALFNITEQITNRMLSMVERVDGGQFYIGDDWIGWEQASMSDIIQRFNGKTVKSNIYISFSGVDMSTTHIGGIFRNIKLEPGITMEIHIDNLTNNDMYNNANIQFHNIEGKIKIQVGDGTVGRACLLEFHNCNDYEYVGAWGGTITEAYLQAQDSNGKISQTFIGSIMLVGGRVEFNYLTGADIYLDNNINVLLNNTFAPTNMNVQSGIITLGGSCWLTTNFTGLGVGGVWIDSRQEWTMEQSTVAPDRIETYKRND